MTESHWFCTSPKSMRWAVWRELCLRTEWYIMEVWIQIRQMFHGKITVRFFSALFRSTVYYFLLLEMEETISFKTVFLYRFVRPLNLRKCLYKKVTLKVGVVYLHQIVTRLVCFTRSRDCIINYSLAWGKEWFVFSFLGWQRCVYIRLWFSHGV